MFQHGEKRQQVLQDREHEGYFYVVNKSCHDVIYLECKGKTSKTCRATAIIIDGHFILKNGHNHPTDNREKIAYQFKNALYTAVTTSLRSYRVLYDEVCERDPDGAVVVPFEAVEQSMRRWRQTICPRMPTSWTNYVQLLDMEAWQRFTTYDDGRLNVAIVRGRDRSTAVVYGDIEFLSRIRAIHIYVDATFKVCPRKPESLQLLTIMTQVDDATLPIAWALMTRKTTEAYVAVLHHFATILAPHIRPDSYMTDFERALSTALRIIYPEAISERCYFHYCQAVMKYAKKKHLLRQIRNCENKKIVFRKIMALPLFPAEDIVAAFEWIVTHSSPEVERDFALLFQYVENYWLHNVTPEVLSVFGMACKTNNAVESYHRVLQIRMGMHPPVWEFTEHLRRLQIVVRSSTGSLELGRAIGRPSAERQLIQQRILQRAWHLYQEHLLDIPRFLACASNCLKAFGNENLLIAEAQVDNYANPAINDVNGDQHLPIFFEEDLDGIEVFIRRVPQGGEEIIIPGDLDLRRCALCRNHSMDTIGLPCCHWVACVRCTAQLIGLAATANAEIRCSVCGNICTAFHQIIIVHRFVRCKDRQTQICPALGRIINGVFTLVRGHSHPSTEALQATSFFMRQLYRSTMSELRPVSNIYRSLKDLYPEAAEHVDEKSILKRMIRWRVNLKPPVPQTYVQLRDILDSVEWRVCRVHDEGVLNISLKMEEDAPVALIFWDAEFLRKVATCTELHVTTTMRVLPDNMNDTAEFVTVVAIYRDHAFPCVWGWIPSRGSSAFAAILEPVQNLLHPHSVYGNFDERLHTELTNAFGDATVTGDFGSYCTAVLQEGKRQELDIAEDLQIRSTMKKLFGLALLPSYNIREAFDSIRNSQLPENIDRLANLFTYFEETWLETVKPRGFSMYRSFRTILNCTYTAVQMVENKLRGDHGVWNFIHGLLGIQCRSHLDVDRTNQGKIVTATPRVRSLISQAALTRLWRLLATENITPDRFLELCCNMLEPFLENLLFHNEPLIDDFQPIVREFEGEDDIYGALPAFDNEDNPNHNNQIAEIAGQPVDAVEPREAVNVARIDAVQPREAANVARIGECEKHFFMVENVCVVPIGR